MKQNAVLFSNHDDLLSLYDGIKVGADDGRELMTRTVLSGCVGRPSGIKEGLLILEI